MHIAEELMAAREKFRFAQSSVTVFEVVCLKLATEDRNQPPVNEQPPLRTAPKEPLRVQPAEKPAPKPEIKEEPQPVMAVPEPEETDIEPVKEAETVMKPAASDMIPASAAPESGQIEFDLLELLVQCRKDEKKTDEELYDHVYAMMDLTSRRYTAILHDTKIGASGKDCLILICTNMAAADRINDMEMNEELYRFIKKRLGIDKMVFAVTESQFKEASRTFRMLMHSNQLPEACHIERYPEEKKKEETAEDKIKALFGAENVEII
jgi:hypothetical protein